MGWLRVRAVRSNRCVTGRRPRDMKTTRSDLNSFQRIESWARDRQPIIGVSDVSDDTASKGVQALARPGPRKKIWDKKKSHLWVYVSLSIYQTNNNLWSPFENKMRYIFFIKMHFVRSLSLVMLLVVHKDTTEYATQWSGFKYRKWLEISAWPTDRTLTGFTTLS